MTEDEDSTGGPTTRDWREGDDLCAGIPLLPYSGHRGCVREDVRYPGIYRSSELRTTLYLFIGTSHYQPLLLRN